MKNNFISSYQLIITPLEQRNRKLYFLICLIGQLLVSATSFGQFPSTLELANLCGSNGFVIHGIDDTDFSGYSVSAAGDVNGDGFYDILIGAVGGDPNGNVFAGESYLVFGSNAAFPPSLDLSSLDGTNGFVLNGVDAYDQSGVSVSTAGDVNGDGFDDIIIGALGAYPNGIGDAGESYVVFGSNAAFSPSFDLGSLNGMNGFVLNGIDSSDNSGFSVSTAGDVNGDGFDDIIIGAPNAGTIRAGESYVVFGSNSSFQASFELSSLNGTNGFVLQGIDAYDNSGFSVSTAGDVNGDGLDDLIIGAPRSAPNGYYHGGESYVVFGSNSVFPPSFNLSSLNGTNGFILNGIDAHDISGEQVSTAGDVNGDGFDDIIIAAPRVGPGSSFYGESYVVFGSNSVFPSSIDLSSLNGTTGFVLKGLDYGDYSGSSVSTAGDVNDDGFDDLIIGARSADPNGGGSGESYVIFGGNAAFPPSFDLSSLDGMNGFVLNGVEFLDLSGNAVNTAGDVNGDGANDLIVGARQAGPNGTFRAGESYIIFGSCGPSLFVNGGGLLIPNCVDNPRIDDLTLFDGVCNQNYMLDNSKGTEDLIIYSIVSTNPAFTIILSGFPLTIPAGASLSMPISYSNTGNPIELSTIIIDNNDCNDKSYTFTIQSPDLIVICDECPDVILDSSNPLIDEDLAAHISITTNGNTATNTTIDYHAGVYLEFIPGFEVELSTVFHAYISPCN